MAGKGPSPSGFFNLPVRFKAPPPKAALAAVPWNETVFGSLVFFALSGTGAWAQEAKDRATNRTRTVYRRDESIFICGTSFHHFNGIVAPLLAGIENQELHRHLPLVSADMRRIDHFKNGLALLEVVLPATFKLHGDRS